MESKPVTAAILLSVAFALSPSLAFAASERTATAEPPGPQYLATANTTAAGKAKPKALNPQPEVPSKGGMAVRSGPPKALNPQPEVPSKKKKKTKLPHDGKKSPG